MPSEKTRVSCYHCGNDCDEELIQQDGLNFCCNGCVTVYTLLKDNDLCDYYTIENTPGINVKSKRLERFAYLDDLDTIKSLLEFEDESKGHITFYIPQIHCYSCLWLLEKLPVLNDGIISSKTNYLKKEISVVYAKDKTSLRGIVELLTSIGYEPVLNQELSSKDKDKRWNRRSFFQIGLTGFCFGNIMLLSFPEYFSGISSVEEEFAKYFGIISFVLSLPILLWGAVDYLKSAFHSIKQFRLNLDVPISLGIIALFVVSSFEVFTKTGVGYFDSLAGLVFFLLLGKSFQQKTFDQLNFERDFKSYFPLAVTKITNGLEVSIAVAKLTIGDRLLVRNEEIVPSDGVLMTSSASIDYSFVTGESNPEDKIVGDKIFAGGRVLGKAVEIEILKKPDQSYLTRLWNSHESDGQKENLDSLSDKIGKYFTFVVLFLSIGAGLFWFSTDVARALKAFTSVLIIACPCALALAIPFTFGNGMRILAKHGLYLKNTAVIERMSSLSQIIFDKTGTLTDQSKSFMSYHGDTLSKQDLGAVKSLLHHSSHPLSRIIVKAINTDLNEVSDFIEVSGKGVEGKVNGFNYKIGSSQFVDKEQNSSEATSVFVAIGGEVKGVFKIESSYRTGLSEMFQSLLKKFKVTLLSGDSHKEKTNIDRLTSAKVDTHFKQSPFDKRNFVFKLEQEDGEHCMMVGDGLNDAGALKASSVGISVTDNVTHFTPASDGILDAHFLNKIPEFIEFARSSKRIVYLCFTISFAYNLIGLYFAVQGNLSPVIAAILMPISSLSVVVVSILSTNLIGLRLKSVNK